MWFLGENEKVCTVTDTSRLSQDGSCSHTGILDVGEVGGDLTTLVGHSGLTTVNKELKVAVANEDVRGGESSSATPIVASNQARWQAIARKSPSLVVRPLGYRRTSCHQGGGEQR